MQRNTTTRDLHRRTIARAKPACAICGQPIDYTLRWPHPRSYVADHIIPLDAGGLDDLPNKQPAHNDCNSKKRARLTAPIVRTSGSLA